MAHENDSDDEFTTVFLAARDDGGSFDDDSLGDTDEPGGPEAHTRRSRAVALIGLGSVVALVAVVITLVSLLVDTSPGAPAGPRTTAAAWADALVGGDSAREHNLECAAGSAAGHVVALVVTDASSANAGTARRRGPSRWTVPVAFAGPDGSVQTSLSLTVVRESGRYVVC